MATLANGPQAAQLHRLVLQTNQLQALGGVLQTAIATGVAKQSNGAALATPCCLTVASLATALLTESPGAALYLVGSTVALVLAGETHTRPKDIDLVLVLGPEQNNGATPEFSKRVDGLVQGLKCLPPNLPVRHIAHNKILIKTSDGRHNNAQYTQQGGVPVDLLVQTKDAPFEYDEVGNSRRIQLIWGSNDLKAYCESEWPHDLIQAMQEARLLWFNPDMNQDALYRALKAMLKAQTDGLGNYYVIQPGVLQGFCKNLFDGVRREQKEMQTPQPNPGQAGDNKTRGPYLNAAMKMVLGVLDGTYFDIFLQEGMKENLKPHFDFMYQRTKSLLGETNQDGEINWVDVNFQNTEKYFPSDEEKETLIRDGKWVEKLQKINPFAQKKVIAWFFDGNGKPFEFILNFEIRLLRVTETLDRIHQDRLHQNLDGLLSAFSAMYAIDSSYAKSLSFETLGTIKPHGFLRFAHKTPNIERSKIFYDLALSYVGKSPRAMQGWLNLCLKLDLTHLENIQCIVRTLAFVLKKPGSETAQGKPKLGSLFFPLLPVVFKIETDYAGRLRDKDKATLHNFKSQIDGEKLLQHLIANPDFLAIDFALDVLVKCNRDDPLSSNRGTPFSVLLRAVEGVQRKHPHDEEMLKPWLKHFFKVGLENFDQLDGDWKKFFSAIKNWIACLNELGLTVGELLDHFPQTIKTLEQLGDTAAATLEDFFQKAVISFVPATLPAWAGRVCKNLDGIWTVSNLASSHAISKPAPGVYEILSQDRTLTTNQQPSRIVVCKSSIHHFLFTKNLEGGGYEFSNRAGFKFEIRKNQTSGETTVRCCLSNHFSPTLTFTLSKDQSVFPYLAVLVEVFNALQNRGANFHSTCPWRTVLNKLIALNNNGHNGLVLGYAFDDNTHFYGFLEPNPDRSAVALGWLCLNKKSLVEKFAMFVRVKQEQFGSALQKTMRSNGIDFGVVKQGQEIFVPHGAQLTIHADGTEDEKFFLLGCKPSDIPGLEATKDLMTAQETSGHPAWVPLIYSESTQSWLNLQGQGIEYKNDYICQVSSSSTAQPWAGAVFFNRVGDSKQVQNAQEGTLMASGFVFSRSAGFVSFEVSSNTPRCYQISFFYQGSKHSFNAKFQVSGKTFIENGSEETKLLLNEQKFSSTLGFLNLTAQRVCKTLATDRQSDASWRCLQLLCIPVVAGLFCWMLQTRLSAFFYPLGRRQI